MHSTSFLGKMIVAFEAVASKILKNTSCIAAALLFLEDCAIKWDKEKNELIFDELDLKILMRNEKSRRDLTDFILKTAKQKNEYGIPPIFSPLSLMLLLPRKNMESEKAFWIQYRGLLEMSNATQTCYMQREVLKKNGGTRKVFQVNRCLTDLQRWILINILEPLPHGPYAYAYRKGFSVLDNAVLHTGKDVLVKLDMKSFFDSITYSKVYGVFAEHTGYPKAVLTFLSKICTLNNKLPQGAVTSPALSNLVMAPIDEKIAEWCSYHSITYSRYCDDMAFSGSFDPGRLIYHVKKLLRAYGFELNGEKSIVAKQGVCQQVTGIVVNNKPRVDKEYTRQIRQEMYYIKKLGVEEHLRNTKPARFVTKKRVLQVNYMKSLLGRINYALFVNPDDSEMSGYKDWVSKWLKRNSAFDPDESRIKDNIYQLITDNDLPF